MKNSTDSCRSAWLLQIGMAPNPFVLELVGDGNREDRPVVVRNYIQHYVHCRSPAGTGEPVLIDLEQAVPQLDFGEVFDESGRVLPMCGATIAAQNASLGQDIGTRADRPDRRSRTLLQSDP